jgi:hypothetical protein
MFEQLVRPFQTRQIGTTRRIVPVKTDEPQTPEEARLTWGSVGALAQGVVQPKATNLENIESVGWNVRGNIDNFHQTSREGEMVTVPVKDNAGNTIGETTIDRTKEIGFQKPYLPNFGYNQNYRPGRKPFSYSAEGKPKRYDITPSDDFMPKEPPPVPPPKPDPPPDAPPPSSPPPGLRQDVPGRDLMGANYTFTYS